MKDQDDTLRCCEHGRPERRPPVKRGGKWLLEGFIASLALDWADLRESDPSLPISLPRRAFEVEFWAGLLGVSPCDFAGHETVLTPTWHSDQRKLYVGKHLIKHFHQPARNQEALLNAFTEEAWRTVIDDPLPPEGDTEPRKRLRDTVDALNRSHVAPGILKFHVTGNGESVTWDIDEAGLRSVSAPAEARCERR